MVGVLVRWRWKGEKKGEKKSREREKDTRERIIYHFRLPNNTKEKSTTCIQIPTSYKYICTEIQIYQRYLPQPSLLDITPTLAFVIHITTRSHYTST